jgi:hypothetical protein
MNRNLLIIGAAAAALVATGASAATHKHHGHAKRDNYAAPAQPIPYAELDSYVGGSHSSSRMAQPMASGAAAGGMNGSAADTSAAPASSPPATPAPTTPPPQ